LRVFDNCTQERDAWQKAFLYDEKTNNHRNVYYYGQYYNWLKRHNQHRPTGTFLGDMYRILLTYPKTGIKLTIEQSKKLSKSMVYFMYEAGEVEEREKYFAGR
jgi:hypothetical protein